MIQSDSVADSIPLEIDSENLSLYAAYLLVCVLGEKKSMRNVESKIRNKGKFNCDALATEGSANHMGSSETGWHF